MPTSPHKRSYVEVCCCDCGDKWLKRSDGLKEWGGRCSACAYRHLHADPEIRKKISRTLTGKMVGLMHHSWLAPRRCVDCGKDLPKKSKNPTRCFDCFAAYHRGEKHWNWQGGITPENRLVRHSKEYEAWRQAVFERDKLQALRQSWCCLSARFPGHYRCPAACPVPLRCDAEHRPLLPFALGQTAKITAPRLAQSPITDAKIVVNEVASYTQTTFSRSVSIKTSDSTSIMAERSALPAIAISVGIPIRIPIRIPFSPLPQHSLTPHEQHLPRSTDRHCPRS